jgi:carboxylesterase
MKTPKIMEGAESVEKGRGKTGILMLHGFTSTPNDFPWIIEKFPEDRFRISAPLLAGHGTSPEHLDTTTWHDWYVSAEKAYLKLKKNCDRTVIIGSSSGGNLGVLLASKHKTDALIMMGTIMKFRAHGAIFLLSNIARIFKKQIRKVHYPLEINAELEKKIHYRHVPLKSMNTLFELMKHSRKELPNITAPTLIIQSSDDFLAKRKNLHYIYNNIKSGKKQAVLIENAFHLPVFKEEKEKVANLITQYIDTQII